MAHERLSMRKIKEVLRLRLACSLSERQIAASCHVARSTVGEYLARAKAAGLESWSAAQELAQTELEARLFPEIARPAGALRPLPDGERIHEELRNKHVTLALLWQEYKEAHPSGYGYTQFVHYYNAYKKKLDLVMRQQHKAGEKVFVDYSGDGFDVINADTGEITRAELFVAVWGASNYTYAEATLTQELPSWIGSHVRAFDYFGCAPRILVPDNLKSGVNKTCRYEPDLNPAYQDLAVHYNAAVIPARVRHPRDKAKVEAGVLVAQRWILAALRKRQFSNLAELNSAIRELLARLNERPMRKIKKSRRQVFEELDRPAAQKLPERPYEYAAWKKARVNIDYHIELEAHYYSAPCRLAGQEVHARLTQTTVEIFHQGHRVRSHPRSFERYKHSTHPEDMPEAHRRYAEWSPSRIIEWAAKTGPKTAELVEKILASKDHPEQGYRSALGVIRLERHCGCERLEAASKRALVFGSFSYQSVKRILDRGLDRAAVPQDGAAVEPRLPFHENIRGSECWDSQENQKT